MKVNDWLAARDFSNIYTKLGYLFQIKIKYPKAQITLPNSLDFFSSRNYCRMEDSKNYDIDDINSGSMMTLRTNDGDAKGIIFRLKGEWDRV